MQLALLSAATLLTLLPGSSASTPGSSASTAGIKPEQFHIATAGTSGMRVSFKTNTSTPLSCSFGSSASSLNLTAVSEAPRSYFPLGGFYHHVLLPNISSSPETFYSCAGSPTFSFRAPPAPGQDFTMAILADWGYLGSKERGPSLPLGGLHANWTATLTRELLESLASSGNISAVLIPG